MTSGRVRHSFNIPVDISDKLSDITRSDGSSKTQIVIDAISALIDGRAANAIDDRYTHRLDRLLARVESIHVNNKFMAETLATFIQHQLTLVAHNPPFEPETAKLGKLRYEAFLDLVSRRIVHSSSPGLAGGQSANGEAGAPPTD